MSQDKTTRSNACCLEENVEGGFFEVIALVRVQAGTVGELNGKWLALSPDETERWFDTELAAAAYLANQATP